MERQTELKNIMDIDKWTSWLDVKVRKREKSAWVLRFCLEKPVTHPGSSWVAEGEGKDGGILKRWRK